MNTNPWIVPVLHDAMNTDDLCEAWLSFVISNGLEQESDDCDNDAAVMRDYLKGLQETESAWNGGESSPQWQDPIIAWLDEYVTAWCRACDAEWRIGHGIETHNGWTPPTN